MDLGILVPVAAITAGPIAWVANNWVRARHGFVPVDRKGRVATGDVDPERKVELMAAENERLTGQVLRLEERIAVLERIATDPATRIAHEIEQLRVPAKREALP
jgi:hypothetical protein